MENSDCLAHYKNISSLHPTTISRIEYMLWSGALIGFFRIIFVDQPRYWDLFSKIFSMPLNISSITSRDVSLLNEVIETLKIKISSNKLFLSMYDLNLLSKEAHKISLLTGAPLPNNFFNTTIGVSYDEVIELCLGKQNNWKDRLTDIITYLEELYNILILDGVSTYNLYPSELAQVIGSDHDIRVEEGIQVSIMCVDGKSLLISSKDDRIIGILKYYDGPYEVGTVSRYYKIGVLKRGILIEMYIDLFSLNAIRLFNLIIDLVNKSQDNKPVASTVSQKPNLGTLSYLSNSVTTQSLIHNSTNTQQNEIATYLKEKFGIIYYISYLGKVDTTRSVYFNVFDITGKFYRFNLGYKIDDFAFYTTHTEKDTLYFRNVNGRYFRARDGIVTAVRKENLPAGLFPHNIKNEFDFG